MSTANYSKSIFSSQLAHAIGLVVLEASQAEDTLGELVVLRRGLPEVDLDWWKSGEQLSQAIESLEDPELNLILSEMRRLYPIRNAVVHSLWLEGKGGPVIAMKRGKSTKKAQNPANYEMRSIARVDDLHQVAEEFRTLESMASDAISDAMGISRTIDSGLPQRKTPIAPTIPQVQSP